MVDGQAAEAIVGATLAIGTPANTASASPAGLASVNSELVVTAVEGFGEPPGVCGLAVGECAGPAQGHCGQADESGPHCCRRGRGWRSVCLCEDEDNKRAGGRGKTDPSSYEGTGSRREKYSFLPLTLHDALSVPSRLLLLTPSPTPQSHLHSHYHGNISLFLQDFAMIPGSRLLDQGPAKVSLES